MPLIKRAKALFCGLFVIASLWTAVPVHAAGTLPLAMAQQIDINGQPLAGCQVYFFVAGTPSSPQNAFSDFSLTQSLGPQIQCDQSGRVPMFWLADGLIHVRLTDAPGTPVIDTTMQVLGPSSGGGGGGSTVDPTTLLATGDIKARYGIGPLPGFVRANGLTIGNAGSGATERANADTQALFIYLYGADPNLVVSGGRTGNALNDYNASKTITVPDHRGRGIAALDDMGNSAAGRLTATYFGCAATVLGCAGGSQNATLTVAQLPPIISTNTGAIGINVTSSSPYVVTDPGGLQSSNATGGALRQLSNIATQGAIGSVGSFAIGAVSVQSNNTASSPHAVASPMLLSTIYIKL